MRLLYNIKPANIVTRSVTLPRVLPCQAGRNVPPGRSAWGLTRQFKESGLCGIGISHVSPPNSISLSRAHFVGGSTALPPPTAGVCEDFVTP